MARSSAATPDQYLEELEPARAAELSIVRQAVNRALPQGYVERMAWGMISWEVPLEVSGPTYNKQPLVYAALAAQKNYNALYLTCAYGPDDRAEKLRSDFAAAGKKLDMGKSCVRFRNADDLALEIVEREIASTTPAQFVEITNAARAR